MSRRAARSSGHAREDRVIAPLSQPKFFGFGLLVLSATAVWSYFSFFGTATLLLLYLQSSLAVPGWSQSVVGFTTLRHVLAAVSKLESDYALAAQLTGLYMGLVHLTPLPGGWLADRVLGRDRAVFVGGSIMAVGHFLLGFNATFLVGLLCLILGAGLFEPTLAAKVADLPSLTNAERRNAYYVYYAAINLGGLLAPFIVGTVGERVGWHYGFALAGLGMMIGLLTFRAFRRHLFRETRLSSGQSRLERARAPGADRAAVLQLVVIALVMIGFRVAYWQQSTAFVFWVRDSTDRHIGSFDVPVTWFQALNSLVILAGGPILAVVWSKREFRGLETAPLVKMAGGCALLAIANILLAAAAYNTVGLVSWTWSALYMAVLTVGELFTVPVGLALFATSAPERFKSSLIGLWYVITFAGSVIAGFVAGYWPSIQPARYWLGMAGIAGASAAMLAVLGSGPISFGKIGRANTRV